MLGCGDGSGLGGTAGTGGTTGSAGTGGTTGSAGTDGMAGSAGMGGTTGNAGTGGSAGTGGTAGSAGSGGTGGAGGSAGTGGVVALACNQAGNLRGDFDGDGVADCARVQAGTGARLDLEFNKGIGGGSYLAATVVTPNVLVPTYQGFGPVFDLNHDTRQDIIVLFPDDLAPNQYSHIQFFRGGADGRFDVHVLEGPNPPPGVLVMGRPCCSVDPPRGMVDFDGDGFPDLLLISSDYGLYANFSWIVLKSAGGLDFQIVQSVGVQSLRGVPVVSGVADLNGDGKLDLAVLALASQSSIILGMPSYVVVSFGTGTGGFSTTRIAGTDGVTNLSVGDANTDGKPDLLVTLPGGTTPFYGNGAGQFSTTAP